MKSTPNRRKKAPIRCSINENPLNKPSADETVDQFSLRPHQKTAKGNVAAKDVDDLRVEKRKRKKSDKGDDIDAKDVGVENRKRRKLENERSLSSNMWCHQCKSSKCDLVACKKCQMKRYCVKCAEKWYPVMFEETLFESCPLCCNNCNCKKCLGLTKNLNDWELELTKDEKFQHSKHIIQTLLPIVKRFSEEQMCEMDLEAKIQGFPVAEVKLQKAECMDDERISCNHCKTSIADFHRCCSDCSYELCLTCCQELRKSCFQGDDECGYLNFSSNEEPQIEKSQKSSKFKNIRRDIGSGRIPCPSLNFPCCGTLQLKCVYPENWVAGLAMKAEEIVKTFRPKDQLDISRCRCAHPKKNALYKAASREADEDNYLCCLTAVNIEGKDVQHLCNHLSKGEPIIVNNVLETTSRLSWEPMVMWRAWRNMKNGKASVPDADVLDCSNWCQVNMTSYQFFKGYIEGRFDSNGQPQLLKLQDWSQSVSFEERLPRHAAEYISCLPFKEVTHPHRGYLNLSTKLPEKCVKPISGPIIHIGYGIPQEMGLGNSVTKLLCAAADVVNILFHTGKQENTLQSRGKVSDNGATYCESTEDLNVRQNEQHQSETLPSSANNSEGCGDEDAGVVWDVFRRQDVPILQEYLKFHSGEFNNTLITTQKQVSHPVYDQNFYLTEDHKRRLKEEYGIQPWTFMQKVGDSVIVPAGCPHQTRNLKSCISVALEFISPESINESIRLTEEFRHLPEDHMAKEDRLEIKKLILHSLSSAINDFEEVLKLNLDAYIEDSCSMGSDSKGVDVSKSLRSMHPSLQLDEVFTASSQQENLTTPDICQSGQPSHSPSLVSEDEIQNKQIDMERVDLALKKLESFSSARPNQLLSTSNFDEATMDTSPVVRAKAIWEDFMTYPLKVFGNLSNEVTALHAISELNENLALFDDKEAKLLAEHKEILSSIVRTRGVKEQLQRENQHELTELDACLKHIDNLRNCVSNLKAEYDALESEGRELERKKQEIIAKMKINSSKKKRLGGMMEQQTVKADEVIHVTEKKEALASIMKEKLTEADCVIDDSISRFFAMRSQYSS